MGAISYALDLRQGYAHCIRSTQGDTTPSSGEVSNIHGRYTNRADDYLKEPEWVEATNARKLYSYLDWVLLNPQRMKLRDEGLEPAGLPQGESAVVKYS
jgi:hypothetical protein